MTKTQILADLAARAANAAALEDRAEREMNESLRRKAAVRWWRRCLEYSHIEAMPVGAVCMACAQPDGGWPADFWQNDRLTWLCLEHATDMHERAAEARVALEEGELDACDESYLFRVRLRPTGVEG